MLTPAPGFPSWGNIFINQKNTFFGERGYSPEKIPKVVANAALEINRSFEAGITDSLNIWSKGYGIKVSSYHDAVSKEGLYYNKFLEMCSFHTFLEEVSQRTVCPSFRLVNTPEFTMDGQPPAVEILGQNEVACFVRKIKAEKDAFDLRGFTEGKDNKLKPKKLIPHQHVDLYCEMAVFNRICKTFGALLDDSDGRNHLLEGWKKSYLAGAVYSKLLRCWTRDLTAKIFFSKRFKYFDEDSQNPFAGKVKPRYDFEEFLYPLAINRLAVSGMISISDFYGVGSKQANIVMRLKFPDEDEIREIFEFYNERVNRNGKVSKDFSINMAPRIKSGDLSVEKEYSIDVLFRPVQGLSGGIKIGKVDLVSN